MKQQLTEAVKVILAINVIMFLIGESLGSGVEIFGTTLTKASLMVYYPLNPSFHPYQIITHMFMHANLGHIFFNMFALYMFGPLLENSLGTKRFTILYFVSGLGALALTWFVQYLEFSQYSPVLIQQAHEAGQNIYGGGMLGASGCIFGLLAATAMLFPNLQLYLIFPPIPIKAKYFVAIYAGVELFLGLGGYQAGVAHFAHVGGAIAGALLIYYWRQQK